MKCKYCQADMDDDSTICPACGKDNAVPAEEETETAETVSEETEVSEISEASEVTEEAAESEEAEQAPESEKPEQDSKSAGTPKMTAGKLTLIIAAAVVAIALVVALIVTGINRNSQPADATDPTDVPATSENEEGAVPDLNVPELTIPADGDPENVTCKGTYTVADDVLLENKDKVIATVDDQELTVGMLQMYYWMSFYEFAGNYGSYLPMFGLDVSQPLDKQPCNMMADTMGQITWQQYFLYNALNTWHRYQAMSIECDDAGIELDAEFQAYMDGMEESLQASAVQYGFETALEMIQSDVGAAGSLEDYKQYRLLAYKGYQYFDQEYSKLNPTDEEVDAYFAEHAEEFAAEDITKESGNFVDVRHILIAPEGGTKDEEGNVTYSDEEWAAAEEKAQSILDEWLAGDKTEESFANLAKENSTDPGSKDKGGLYTGVRQGQMVPEFDAWCFDAERQIGDYGIVKTDFGYHIMYFVHSDPVWYISAKTSLLNDLSNAVVNAATEKYPMTIDYPSIVIADVKQEPQS